MSILASGMWNAGPLFPALVSSRWTSWRGWLPSCRAREATALAITGSAHRTPATTAILADIDTRAARAAVSAAQAEAHPP